MSDHTKITNNSGVIYDISSPIIEFSQSFANSVLQQSRWSASDIVKVQIATVTTSITFQFKNWPNLKKVVSGDVNNSQLTEIGNDIFKDCTNLTSITYPKSVEHLGTSAFQGCTSLPTISIRNPITSIGASVFKGCSALTSVAIYTDSLLTSIPKAAFKNCTNLTSIMIPASVVNLYGPSNEESGVFQGCTSLSTVNFAAGRVSDLHIYDKAFKGCTNLSTISIPPLNTDLIGAEIFTGSGLSGNIIYIEQPNPTISSDFSYNVNVSNFYGAQNVTLYENIIHTTFIDISDISYNIDISGVLNTSDYISDVSINNLKSVIIGTPVTSIGVNAFNGAPNLTVAYYAGSSELTSIQAGAFQNSGLTSIDIPHHVETIGNNAFQNSSLTSVEIPNHVTSIGESAFSITSLSTVTFETGSSVTSIGNNAFHLSGLTSVEIPNSVETIGDSAFFQSQLSSLTFESHSSLTTIGTATFNSSKFNSIEIPKSVTSIGDSAFYFCYNLSSVTFEANSSLNIIGPSAFENTSSLTSIVIPSSVTDISSNSFTSSDISGKTIGIEQPSSLDVSYNTPTTFFGATNVTIVRALSPPSGNGWYLFGSGSSGLSWSSSKIAWGLNGYNIYQYIYDLSGSPIPGGTPLTSDNWTATDISGSDPVLPEYSAYWVQVIT